MLLVVKHEVFDEVVVVRVEGDIDLASAEEFAEQLAVATTRASLQSSPTLVVDLQGVDFFGSAGLNVLLGCHDKATADGISVRLVAAQPEVVRPIQVTKLDRILALYPSMDEALTPRNPA